MTGPKTESPKNGAKLKGDKIIGEKTVVEKRFVRWCCWSSGCLSKKVYLIRINKYQNKFI